MTAALMAAPAAAGTFPAFACRDETGRTSLAPPHGALPPGCLRVTLPFSLDRIRFAHLISRAVPRDGTQLILDGAGRGDTFKASSARFAELSTGPEPLPPLPFATNLLGRFALRTFGAEERVAANRAGEDVEIVCRPGAKPAGLILDPSTARLPEGAVYAVELAGEGDPGFSAAMAPQGGGAEGARPLEFPRMELPSSRDSLVWAVILCPEAGGRMSLRSVSLVPKGQPRPLTRAAWAWETTFWRDDPERLIGEAAGHGIDRLFVSVEIDGSGIRDERRLTEFVSAARARGIAVVAVEGDPAMALEQGRPGAVERLEALAAFQRRAPAASRLAGVQYDIEPYILPRFGAEPAVVLRGWARTIEALGAAADGLPLDMVLPFWLPARADAAELVLPAVAKAASNVTVMAYRTSPDAVLAAAEPLLAWGTKTGRPVTVALEAGPLGDEVSRFYAPANRGEVAILPLRDAALVLALAEPIPNGQAYAYTLVRETVSTADRVSFLGNTQEMKRMSGNMITWLQAWPSFSGLAFHGLIR